MKLYIAVTDNDWYRFLSHLTNIDEVNFWQPGGNQRFQRLDSSELFLFKLHSPLNFIVGGGFFAHSSIVPVRATAGGGSVSGFRIDLLTSAGV
jgi:putative restriction endonuclease